MFLGEVLKGVSPIDFPQYDVLCHLLRGNSVHELTGFKFSIIPFISFKQSCLQFLTVVSPMPKLQTGFQSVVLTANANRIYRNIREAFNLTIFTIFDGNTDWPPCFECGLLKKTADFILYDFKVYEISSFRYYFVN